MIKSSNKESLERNESSKKETLTNSENNYNVALLSEKMGFNDALEKIKKENVGREIEYIQPDYRMTVASLDPLSEMQWGLDNNKIKEDTQIADKDAASEEPIVAFPFTAGANVIPAWDNSQGEGVIVAVIDTGIDITHEDLSENIWRNSNEIPNNGIDDDENGFVDDINGWDFCENNNSVHKQEMMKEEWHGTHIAGIIAASKDNNKGIAGVAPKAKIMPLRVFKDGSAYTSDIIKAIEYAEKMGAKIVNCSWGSTEINPALKETIEKSKMIFVCSAGNNAMDIGKKPVFPARYESSNIITVASLNKDGSLSRFSNYSDKYVHVTAPGQNIISTIPGNAYEKSNGTSMAAGFVSGEAAILLVRMLLLVRKI